jgi:Tol biopolymer transport system component
VRIGAGVGLAISPDGKWVITQPGKGGPLSLVPTGAGEARQLTHDNVSYERVRWLAGGQELLASGSEAGRGTRDYLIKVSNGDSRPITTEGVVGLEASPDGRSVAVLTPDRKWGVWPLAGGDLRPIPNLDATYRVRGWSPDGTSVLATPARQGKTVNIYRVNLTTGKMELTKTLGEDLAAGAVAGGVPYLSSDGNAYAYNYEQVLSQVYVVRGMR